MADLKNDSVLFGGDYNPEQWPESSWQNDIDKLKRASVNVATINVFSWSLLEPREDKYDFKMLDKIVDLLNKNDIKMILATSTAAIPAWISHKYPDVSRTDIYGKHQIQGKRHNACPNSSNFKKLTQGLVTELATRYSDCSNLICWHVSNEYEGYCYCDNCAKAFRKWLKRKYGTLKTVNREWNTNFWSHTYYDWDEIEPPMMTTDLFPNQKSVISGAAIDYRRFQSESLLSNYRLERDIIKQFDQIHPVTTNFIQPQKDIDYFEWAPYLDVISWDSYPMPDDTADQNAFQHDVMRGLKKKPFLLMEQTPNQQNWYPYNVLKKPGEMRMLSYQAIAHGANSIEYFQLKQSRSGAEKFHGAVLSHSNSENTRTFREVAKLGAELKKLPNSFLETNIQTSIAIVFDWDSFWGLENSIGPIANLSYMNEVLRFYKSLYQHDVTVDVVSKHDDFDNYHVVIAPTLYMLSNDFASNIKQFVKNGGKFLTTYMSGIANETDNIFEGGYLGPIKELMGVSVDERDARRDDQPIDIISKKGQLIGTATGVCDLVIPEDAETLATYSDDVFYSDYAAITRHRYGQGESYYCGAGLDEKGISYLFAKMIPNYKNEFNRSVEITVRSFKTKNYVFLINTSDETQTINNHKYGTYDLLSGKKFGTRITLAPFDVVILN